MPAASNPTRPKDAQDSGFILVAALWILAALAALTVIFSVYLSSSARALRLDDEAVQSEALISAAVELTAYQLLLAKEDERPEQGRFHVRLGDDELEVSFLTEAARIDLNAAPKEMIANLFTTLGAASEAAQDYADRVVAWRSKPAATGGAQLPAAARALRPRG